MGIKHLWSLLEPYAERKPLSDLQGKLVCVDLSGWVCESMNITDYKIQPKMYLKHLFFRSSYLLLANITPIFITEGETPELKFQVIAKRNQMQFMGARPRAVANSQSQNPKNPKGRTRFNHILKQCEELIGCLGIQSIQPPGEAEAYAAHLNALGVIDGVISQDSDCFAYGARRVYRNFSVAQTAGGMVDVYDLDRINRLGTLDLGQDKVIVMGLLCGCDYCPEGVEGVGKDGTQKLLAKYSNSEIMNVIQGWRYEITKFERLERRVSDTLFCNSCGHLGKLASHTRKGCGECGTTKSCNAELWKNERLEIKQELQIRSKALLQKDFPSTQIIHEFKKKLDPPKEFESSWGQPNIVKFVKVMGRHLEWSEIYAFQKVFPLLTRWQLYQTNVSEISRSQRGFVVPSFIKKRRNLKSIPSYEIIWRDEHNFFRDLFPDEQLSTFLLENENDADILWTTVEPAALVDHVYPHLISEFEAAKLIKKSNNKKPPSKTKRVAKSPSLVKKKSKPNDSLNNFMDMESELNAIPVKKKLQSRGPRKIDKFFKVDAAAPVVHDSLLSELLDDPNDDCENIGDLSNLITGLVSRSPVVKRIQGCDLMYSEFEEVAEGVVTPEEKEQEDQHQSLDDIDLMIMKRKAKPKNNRVSSLRMELMSSTPKGPAKGQSHRAAATEQSSFFSPATEEDDAFESSYNALIGGNLQEDDE